MKRTLLLVGFWGWEDPLTKATLLPTLHCLLGMKDVSRVVLATVERGAMPRGIALPEGSVHRALRASPLRPKAFARLMDILVMPYRLRGIIREFGVDHVVARSSMAGTIAYPAARSTGVPLTVESVEPHADYMVDCGEWSAFGPFALVTRWSERRQHRYAHRLLSVTANYRSRLVEEGIPAERIHVVPCPVDRTAFAFDAPGRAEVRGALGWQDCIVGVYAGKFGGLYHRELAYRAFARAVRYYGSRARMLVLTAEPGTEVRQGLETAGVPREQMHVCRVAHGDMPRWLSAADYAFSTYRGTPSSAFLSPVKNGEYWANGLPVLLTRGVSDDSALIEAEPLAGAVFDPAGEDLDAALEHIGDLLTRSDQRMLTATFGARARPSSALEHAYREAFNVHMKPSGLTS